MVAESKQPDMARHGVPDPQIGVPGPLLGIAVSGPLAIVQVVLVGLDLARVERRPVTEDDEVVDELIEALGTFEGIDVGDAQSRGGLPLVAPAAGEGGGAGGLAGGREGEDVDEQVVGELGEPVPRGGGRHASGSRVLLGLCTFA